MSLSLPDLLRHRARRHPGAPAFSTGGATVHYGQWYDLTRSWYGELTGRGLRPEERVVLEFRDEDWPSFAAAFVAVLAAGGVVVPLRHPVPPARRAELIGLVDAAGCLTGPGIGPSGTTRWSVAADELTGTPGGPRWPGGTRPPGAPASIMFTSGTTGTPRAVVCPQADLTPALRTRLRVPRPRSRALLTSVAVGTVAAQTVIASCLVNGVHTAVVNPFHADGVADQAEAYGVTAISLVPATARLMVQALERSGRTLPAVLSMVCSSAPLDKPTVAGLARILPAAQITNVYSLTEGGPSLVSNCSPDRAPALGRLGRDVRLVDRDGNDVGPDGTGELWLRGRRVGRDYLARTGGGEPLRGPEAGTRIVAGGWIATGDVCRRDADGVLYFVDRGDDVIVSGGLNIASAVVEAVIRAHPGVRDAAVFGVPHPVLGRVAVAAAVLEEGTTAGDVRTHCLDRLPPEQVPRDVTAVDELPVTPSGKVRKKDLARLYEGIGAPAADAGPAGAPVGDDRTEDLVVAALRSALGGSAVDGESNFYLIGGHSLQAAQVAADLSERLEVNVPAGWLLQYPVVRDFATQITRLRRR